MHRLRPPGPVLELAGRLEAAGYEAWCVGGGVRDALLGLDHVDWDIATSATPDQVRSLFGRKRTIPVGIEFGTSLDDDLARRDFTINAIAYSPSRRELRDPFGGRDDLAARVIRAVGDPDIRMSEDRLRALRALRFTARFGFTIEPATLAAIERSAPHLGRLSAERVKQELEKTMEQVRRPGDALVLWKRVRAFETLIPPLAEVSEAVLRAPDHVAMPGPSRRPRRRLDRLAALFVHLPPATVTATLTDLRFSRQDNQWISHLSEGWHEVGRDMRAGLRAGGIPDATVRRWVAWIGRTRVGSFMRVAWALWCAAEGQAAPAPAAVRALHKRMVSSARSDPVELADLAVDGDDLRRAGVAPGPEMGKILHALLAVVLEDPGRNTTDWLLQEAERIRARERGGTGGS